MRKVVVTGGAGFIGSHLVEELARRGYYVIILDDLSKGKRENLKQLDSEENIEFHKGSVTDYDLLQKLFQSVYYVFHLAAITSVPQSFENPQTCHEVNTTGTLNVLLAAGENDVSKVIYASSCAVYGDTPILPQKEDMLPNPQSPYALTKLMGEQYCSMVQKIHKLPTICLRYFNVYGPRQDISSQYASVIPIFIKKVYEGSPPIIFGDGHQTRDFVFVKDIVYANILAAESKLTGIFNIGKGERTTINQLARLVIKFVGNNVKTIYEDQRPGDIIHSLADITRAKEFGYAPKYSLE